MMNGAASLSELHQPGRQASRSCRPLSHKTKLNQLVSMTAAVCNHAGKQCASWRLHMSLQAVWEAHSKQCSAAGHFACRDGAAQISRVVYTHVHGRKRVSKRLDVVPAGKVATLGIVHAGRVVQLGLVHAGKDEEAEECFHQALELVRAVKPRGHPEAAFTLGASASFCKSVP